MGEQLRLARTVNSEEALSQKIAEVLALSLPKSVEIALIGKWIWIQGETRPYRNELKDLGFSWNSKRQSWQFHTGKKRKGRYNATATFNQIADAHGYRRIAA